VLKEVIGKQGWEGSVETLGGSSIPDPFEVQTLLISPCNTHPFALQNVLKEGERQAGLGALGVPAAFTYTSRRVQRGVKGVTIEGPLDALCALEEGACARPRAPMHMCMHAKVSPRHKEQRAGSKELSG